MYLIYYREGDYIEDGFGICGATKSLRIAKKAVKKINKSISPDDENKSLHINELLGYRNIKFFYQKIPLISSDINKATNEIKNNYDECAF